MIDEAEQLSMAICGVLVVHENVHGANPTLKMMSIKTVTMNTFIDVIAHLYLASFEFAMGVGGVKELPYAMLSGVIHRLTIAPHSSGDRIKATIEMLVNNPESGVALTDSRAADAALRAISDFENINVSIGIVANRVTISIDDA